MNTCDALNATLGRAAAIVRRATGVIGRAIVAGVIVSTPIIAAPATEAAAAAPSEDAARADRYLGQLLSEINARRARVGSPPVAYATQAANSAVDQYLADLTPLMLAYNSCFHGTGNPVPPGWDYVGASGLRGDAHGEVIACPGTDGYWTPARIADSWWGSPPHFQSLYADPDANAVACGTYGPQKNGAAYQTIACITYRI